MPTQSTTTRTELANRSSAGIEVTLIWERSNGVEEVVVCVSDFRAGAYFEIPAKPGSALDVYHHPFAYRNYSSIDYEDSCLAA
jgi:hypothetical protein